MTGMTMVTGKVVNGHIEVEDFELPDGAEVQVYVRTGAYDLTAEEEAELEESFAEIARGEYVDGDEFLQFLRRRSQKS